MRPLALATVLAATDLDPSSDITLETAHDLATAAGAALHVVHVQDPAMPAAKTGERETGMSDMHAVLRRARIPERRAKLHLVHGVPAEAIRALSESLNADVIVVGPPRRRADADAGNRLGGTARAIAAGAGAPCLAAGRRRLALPLTRVVVPLDLSDTARGALIVGLSWASALRAGAAHAATTRLVAVHASDSQGREGKPALATFASEIDTLRRDAGSWAGVEIEGKILGGNGDIAGAITRYATEHGADLVVIGTRGLGLDTAARIGSVSALVVQHSPVPVLLVPPAVWREHLSG